MYTIRIANELFDGPIWTLSEQGDFVPDLLIIKNDKIINELRQNIQKKWDSYAEFNSHEQAMWINEEQMKKDKYILLDLIKQLVNRLNEINDGSFVVEDLETPILNKL